MPAFVKFSRGLLSAYNNLNQKDSSTLYLVYENESATRGALYLGNKLISSAIEGASVNSLGDLSDVSLSSLSDGMLLQYNASTGNGVWEAVALEDILPEGINVSIENSLNNISNPSQKDIAIVNSNAYIYDGSDWVHLTNSDLADRISALETKVGHAADSSQGIAATGLYADLASLRGALDNVYTKSEIAEQIAQAQHLRYQIVANIAAIDTTAATAAYTVYLVPRSDNLTNDGYDEYFVVNGNLEKIGTWGVDLTNYVQTDDNRLLTSAQKDKLDAITLDANDNLVITAAQVSDLNSVLDNAQVIKTVQAGVFNITNEKELQLVGIPSNLLNDYVQTSVFQSTVGDLTSLNNRISTTSTLVDEINVLKDSLIWKTITNE